VSSSTPGIKHPTGFATVLPPLRTSTPSAGMPLVAGGEDELGGGGDGDGGGGDGDGGGKGNGNGEGGASSTSRLAPTWQSCGSLQLPLHAPTVTPGPAPWSHRPHCGKPPRQQPPVTSHSSVVTLAASPK